MKTLTRHLSCILAMSLAPSGVSAQGNIEINQASALEGAIVPGDTAGFPVQIAQSGNYRLTGDLIVPNANTTAIVISSDFVSIDLAGFSIIGPNTCPSDGSPCTSPGSGVGISSSGAATHVRNGTIRGMGSYGVDLASDDGEVAQTRIGDNAGGGVRLGPSSVVEDNRIFSNGSAGIEVDNSAVIQRNLTRNNRGAAILAGVFTRIIDNQLVGGASAGIVGTSALLIRGNSVANYGGTAIDSAGNSLISGNMVLGNSGSGIDAGAGSTVAGNVLHSNGGSAEIIAGAHANVTDNVVLVGNGNGIQHGGSGLVNGNTVRIAAGVPQNRFGLSLGAASSFSNNNVQVEPDNGHTPVGGMGAINKGGNTCDDGAVDSCPEPGP